MRTNPCPIRKPPPSLIFRTSPTDFTFDDDHAVATAGLIQPATLADHLGLRELFDESVHLGAGPGHANRRLRR